MKIYYENYNSKLSQLNKISLENLITNGGTLKSTYYQMLHILDKKPFDNKAITISIDKDEQCMGYVIYYIKDNDNKIAHIAQICVNNKFKRQKIGSQLIEAVIEENKNIEFITADINIYNTISQYFFTSQGFSLNKVENKERYLAIKEIKRI